MVDGACMVVVRPVVVPLLVVVVWVARLKCCQCWPWPQSRRVWENSWRGDRDHRNRCDRDGIGLGNRTNRLGAGSRVVAGRGILGLGRAGGGACRSICRLLFLLLASLRRGGGLVEGGQGGEHGRRRAAAGGVAHLVRADVSRAQLGSDEGRADVDLVVGAGRTQGLLAWQRRGDIHRFVVGAADADSGRWSLDHVVLFVQVPTAPVMARKPPRSREKKPRSDPSSLPAYLKVSILSRVSGRTARKPLSTIST